MTLDKKVPERQNAALTISRPDIPARDWWNEILREVARRGIGLAATSGMDRAHRVGSLIGL
jgi:beta-glucosidase-like glycosyl hydrolase